MINIESRINYVKVPQSEVSDNKIAIYGICKFLGSGYRKMVEESSSTLASKKASKSNATNSGEGKRAVIQSILLDELRKTDKKQMTLTSMFTVIKPQQTSPDTNEEDEEDSEGVNILDKEKGKEKEKKKKSMYEALLSTKSMPTGVTVSNQFKMLARSCSYATRMYLFTDHITCLDDIQKSLREGTPLVLGYEGSMCANLFLQESCKRYSVFRDNSGSSSGSSGDTESRLFVCAEKKSAPGTFTWYKFFIDTMGKAIIVRCVVCTEDDMDSHDENSKFMIVFSKVSTQKTQESGLYKIFSRFCYNLAQTRHGAPKREYWGNNKRFNRDDDNNDDEDGNGRGGNNFCKRNAGGWNDRHKRVRPRMDEDDDC